MASFDYCIYDDKIAKPDVSLSVGTYNCGDTFKIRFLIDDYIYFECNDAHVCAVCAHSMRIMYDVLKNNEASVAYGIILVLRERIYTDYPDFAHDYGYPSDSKCRIKCALLPFEALISAYDSFAPQNTSHSGRSGYSDGAGCEACISTDFMTIGNGNTVIKPDSGATTGEINSEASEYLLIASDESSFDEAAINGELVALAKE